MKPFSGWQVESLTAARKACQAGTEPSDAIRVVNAVLTQLDQIKRSGSKVIFVTVWRQMLLRWPSAAFKLLMSLNLDVSDAFPTFVLILQTFQCCDPDNIQRDGEDWLGIRRQSWHQAVYRTSICEGHIQHLLFLPEGAHEGDHCFFSPTNDFKANSPYSLVLLGLRKSTLWAGHCLHKPWKSVYTQCYLGPTDVFRIVSVQMFAQINTHTCVQCQVVYPREQLFTIAELETMGFVESEFSKHSLYLRKIAVWVIDLKFKYHCTLTSNTRKRMRDLHFASLFTPRKSKGLSGRSLRKLPFLAHALFVKVNIYSCTKENYGKHAILFFKCGLFAYRQWQ